MRIRSVLNLAGCLLLLGVVGCAGQEDGWQAQLRSPDPNVRREAIRAAEKFSDHAVAAGALEPLLADEDPTVRTAAGLALLKIDPGNSACRPLIEQALHKGQGPTFIAVGNCGTNAAWAVPTLVSLLSDRRASIRALAAKTLGQVGRNDHQVEVALQRAVADKLPAVLNAAQNSLKLLQAPTQDSAN